MKNIRLFKPCIGEEELNFIKEAFDRSWIGLGPTVEKFEKEWSNYLGGGFSIALNSCTAALHLALKVFNFKPGSKVLIPSVTFVSTAHAVLYNNLEPVFLDIDEKSFSLCVKDLKNKITDDCVAIIPVHNGGHPCEIEEILDIAKSRNLKVIEDCAHCAGGNYKEKKLGTYGDIGCFSFEEKKVMTTGDGGMIYTENKELYNKIKSFRWCGIDRDTWKRVKEQDRNDLDSYHWHYEVTELGYKYNMNDLAASLGRAQLKKLDWMNSRRATLIKRYNQNLLGFPFLKQTFQYKLEDSAYWLYSIRVKNRDNLIPYLKKNGISTGVHFMPIPLHPLYEKFNVDIPNSLNLWKQLLTLPLFPELEKEEVDYICKIIKNFNWDKKDIFLD